MDQLAVALVAAPLERIAFEERRYLPGVQDPIVLRGYLLRSGKGKLEKHVQYPVVESFIVDIDSVEIRGVNGSITRFNLDGYPVLRTVTAIFRDFLAGSLQRIRKDFVLNLSGHEFAWTLGVVPRDAGILEYLKDMQLEGQGGRVRRVTIKEADGARTIMDLAVSQ